MENVWVAAADGGLARVQELVGQRGVSPNAPDEHAYTPVHAAASYAQLEVLAYLVEQGGDVNITDEDGDTPLYTVEDVDTAQWLVDRGAIIDRRNTAGVSPIEHLEQDFPDVAAFLRARLNPGARPVLSQHAQDAASDALTSNLMRSAGDIMQRAEAQGTDPDEELRAAVSQAVLEGFLAGHGLSAQDSDRESDRLKRPRTEGGR